MLDERDGVTAGEQQRGPTEPTGSERQAEPQGSSNSPGKSSLPPAPVPRWLPNAISLSRIALVPVWVLFAEEVRAQGPGADLGARGPVVAVLVVLGASDVVDGWLARRFHLATNLGATLDAVADKLAQIVTVTYLTVRGPPAFAAMPLWFMGSLIARDVSMAVAWLYVRQRVGRVEATHEWHGKLSSVLLFILVLGVSAGAFDGVALTGFEVLIAALVLASTVRYGWLARAQLSQ